MSPGTHDRLTTGAGLLKLASGNRSRRPTSCAAAFRKRNNRADEHRAAEYERFEWVSGYVPKRRPILGIERPRIAARLAYRLTSGGADADAPALHGDDQVVLRRRCPARPRVTALGDRPGLQGGVSDALLHVTFHNEYLSHIV